MARENRGLLPGSAEMLVLRLLCEQDMYGYQIIEELRRRSDDTFLMKAGTLYPVLHGLEQRGKVESYEAQPGGPAPGKPRRYYRITQAGRGALEEQRAEWVRLSQAVNAVLGGTLQLRGRDFGGLAARFGTQEG